MAKRFNIPSIDLDLLEEQNVDDTIPCYFQPGKILGNLQKESEKQELQECQPSVSSSGCDNASLETKNASAPASFSAEISSNQISSACSSRPSTSFGSAFGNLKSSKYYKEENAYDSTEKGTKSTCALLVNPRQRGNPLLKHIRNVPWEFTEMEPDYVMGKTACALFLSMRYHNLFPNYIHERMKALGKSYQLRVLLVQVDVVEPSQALKDLSVIAILADCTLMVAWSAEEVGNYLETYKMFENKSADLIKEKPFDDSFSQVIDCLTIVRSINKTDATVLLSTFGTLAKLFRASTADLAICPGIGPLKAKRLYEALRKPLMNEKRCAT